MTTLLWVLYQACLCTNTQSLILVWQLRLNDENTSVVLLCTETVKYVVENNPPSRTKRGKRWRIINQILIIHTNLHVRTHTHTPTLSTESSKCYYLVHSLSALRSWLIVMANWFTLDESCITTHRWVPNTTQAFHPACCCWSRLGEENSFPHTSLLSSHRYSDEKEMGVNAEHILRVQKCSKWHPIPYIVGPGQK